MCIQSICRDLSDISLCTVAVRIGLNGRVPAQTRDMIFFGTTLVAHGHAGWVMPSESTMEAALGCCSSSRCRLHARRGRLKLERWDVPLNARAACPAAALVAAIATSHSHAGLPPKPTMHFICWPTLQWPQALSCSQSGCSDGPQVRARMPAAIECTS